MPYTVFPSVGVALGSGFTMDWIRMPLSVVSFTESKLMSALWLRIMTAGFVQEISPPVTLRIPIPV